jgi:hypothetical protein
MPFGALTHISNRMRLPGVLKKYDVDGHQLPAGSGVAAVVVRCGAGRGAPAEPSPAIQIFESLNLYISAF